MIKRPNTKSSMHGIINEEAAASDLRDLRLTDEYYHDESREITNQDLTLMENLDGDLRFDKTALRKFIIPIIFLVVVLFSSTSSSQVLVSWTTEAVAYKKPETPWNMTKWQPLKVTVEFSPQTISILTKDTLVLNIYTRNMSDDSTYLLYDSYTSLLDSAVVRIDFRDKYADQIYIFWDSYQLVYQLVNVRDTIPDKLLNFVTE